MMPVSKEDLKRFIEEGRAAGKDVSGLERELEEGGRASSKVGCCHKRSGYISTGPIRESDFDDPGH